MISKEMLHKLKPWILLSTYIVVLCFIALHVPDIFNFLNKMIKLLYPLFYALIIAFILNQPLKAIEKLLQKMAISLRKTFPILKGKPTKNGEERPIKTRGLAILITLILAIAILTVLSSIIFPQLIASIGMLLNNIVVYTENIVNTVNGWLTSLHLEELEWNLDAARIQTFIDQMTSNIDKIFKTATDWVGGAGMTVVSNISGFTMSLANWFMGFMLSLYLLSSKEKFCRQVKKLIGALLPLELANRILVIGRRSNQTFSSFISGQLLEACILALLFYVGMTLLNMPYALLISSVIGVTSIVPMFGAMLGMVFGCVLIFAINPLTSFWFVIFFQCLQQFEGNVIYPRVVGNSVGLPGIWVLLSIVVFGGMWGLFGMLIAVPGTAVLYTLLSEFVNTTLKKKKTSFDEIGMLSVYSLESTALESEAQEIEPLKTKTTKKRKPSVLDKK